MRGLSTEALSEVMALRDGYESLVQSTLQDAQARAALRRDVDVKYLRLYLLGMLNRTVVWYRPERHLPPKTLGQVWLALFLRGAQGRGTEERSIDREAELLIMGRHGGKMRATRGRARKETDAERKR
jgi:hypothetical protein